MSGALWVLGEAVGDRLARASAEVATLASSLGAAAGLDVVGVVVGASPDGPATELTRYLPRVLTVNVADAAESTVAAAVAPSLAALIEREAPSFVLVAATQDGRDIAGMLAALLGWGVLVNASAVSWTAEGPSVEMSVFGGRLLTTSGFTADRGIVTVRPNSVAALEAPSRGAVEHITVEPARSLPAVRV
ncbi:MAG TPA: hypothetical protein VEG29_01875, partial [Candidatus Binatia bacterium]|nr:hypothetical protein [Candidatus Binatia bacterium]